MNNKHFLLPMISLVACTATASADANQAPTTATCHPTVYVTSATAQTARRNMREHAWARKVADNITSEARWWLNKPDDWILKQVPGPGACYAYGFSGCPICGGSLGIWASAKAAFEDPGHVLCSNGHRLPDKDHPDSGTGYRGKDGRVHYFVGSYNAWVMERLTFGGLNSLSNAYFITGDETYARKAAMLLDAIANVYPDCDIGSWDYPEEHNTGRFHRPQYQVARVLIYYVGDYDMLYNSPALDEPSIRKGMTRRQNIEENLLRNGGKYCMDQSQRGALHNGEADYLRGVLAVGVCLGIDEWVRWPVKGPFGIMSMLENNLGRDGTYYEAASGYSDHARHLYVTFAEPLLNYRGPVFPNGFNLYQHPKFAGYMRLHNLKTNVTGLPAVYGDQAPMARGFKQTDRPFDRSDYMCLEHLYSAATTGAEREELAGLLLWMAEGNVDKVRQSPLDPVWLLCHAENVTKPARNEAPELAGRIVKPDFLGQKGLAFLRCGEAPEAQAALLRFGPSLNHGHFDDLALSYYAKGYDMTYHLGYALGSAHVYVGLAKQTAGHNTVVVNERSQGGDGQANGTGGSLTMFADLPTAKVAQASCPLPYRGQNIDVYDRCVALISDPTTTHTYLVDVFRVGGGKQHDYSFHGLGDSARFGGLNLGAAEKGSVAGPDISWGDKILVDGDIEGYPGKFYWNAPPGNGYGFMVKPQRAEPKSAWSADWAIGTSGTRMRLNMPAGVADEVITAVGPGITKTLPQARFILARRKGENLRSEFIAAIEPHEGSPLVESVERLQVTNPGTTFPAVALLVHLKNKTDDLIYSAPDTESREAGGFTIGARFAHMRLKDGKPAALAMSGARAFRGKGTNIQTPASGWSGTINTIEPGAGIITCAAALPADGSLRGKTIVFSNPGYSRSSAYRIKNVEKQAAGSRILLNETCILGKGIADETSGSHTIVSSIIHEYAKPLWRNGDTRFFQGKRVQGESGASTHVRSAVTSLTLELDVDDPTVFRKGEAFYYHDLQPGDTFTVDNSVSVTNLDSSNPIVNADVGMKAISGSE